jgi:uncharacterized protein YpmB
VSGQTLGVVITENAIAITGYTAVAPTTLTGTLNTTGNVFVFYYTTKSSGGDNGGSGGGSGGGNSGGGSGRPSPSPSVTPPPPVVTPSPPVVVEPVLTWALLNLILSIVGVILAIILVIFALLWRSKKQKEEQGQQSNQGRVKDQQYGVKQKSADDDEEHQKRKQRRTLMLLAAVVLGIVGVVVFFLTEDISRVMAWVDKWTIVNAIILLVEILAAIFTFKSKKEEDKVDEEAVKADQKATQSTPSKIVQQ